MEELEFDNTTPKYSYKKVTSHISKCKFCDKRLLDEYAYDLVLRYKNGNDYLYMCSVECINLYILKNN